MTVFQYFYCDRILSCTEIVLFPAFVKTGFLIFSTIRGQIILCGGASLGTVGCLAASLASTHSMPVADCPPPPMMTTKNVPSHCQVSFGGQKYPQLRTTVLKLQFALVKLSNV